MKTLLNPYLQFNGQCRAAMTFYQQCLGGELTLQRVSESPMAAQMPPGADAQILHSSLTHEDIVIMGSDMLTPNVKSGNSVSLCLNCGSEKEAHSFFNNLSEGGTIKMQLHQTFWGATYGELVDKFGITWMFNYMKS